MMRRMSDCSSAPDGAGAEARAQELRVDRGNAHVSQYEHAAPED
jgi:hypothetical protein